MPVKPEVLEFLHMLAYEKICLSCWLGVLEPYLEEFLVDIMSMCK